MHIDQLNVQLRPRTAWEAMELGTSLVRRHAGAIWKPWLIVTLPVLALIGLLSWVTGQYWLAPILLWWIKPIFERIPLYVISRGVFGAEPGTLETLRAQRSWGWSGMLGYLTWRRFGLARSLLMPVDLLEGGTPAQRTQRRHSLGGGVYGHGVLVTWLMLSAEVMLRLALIALFFMFVPFDLLSDSMRAFWDLVRQDPPAWVKIGGNVVYWLAITLVAPFYVGAGFGLYLNRRTQLEAWDVEMQLRRMRERLTRGASLLVLSLLLGAVPGLVRAQQTAPNTPDSPVPAAPAPAAPAQQRDTLRDVFQGEQVPQRDFEQSVRRAYESPLLRPTREESSWKRRAAEDPAAKKEKVEKKARNSGRERGENGLMRSVSGWIALIGEWGLWILLGVVLLLVLITWKWWTPWLRGGARRTKTVQAEVEHDALVIPEVLPPDLVTRARTLWQEGRPRSALALLYRAGVETVSIRSQVDLPPGATESQCLRAAQRMPDAADRQLFARMVRAWQYAAYAGRLPDEDEFMSLLDGLGRQFGWAR